MKTQKLLDSVLIRVCAVIASTTVVQAKVRKLIN